jgi:hypothetical protein
VVIQRRDQRFAPFRVAELAETGSSGDANTFVRLLQKSGQGCRRLSIA